jgi:nickel-dependent lactate racemase
MSEGSFHPDVAPGVLEGNPVHEDMIEIARFKEPDFIINVVLDDENNLINCFSGHFLDAHRAGCEYVMENRSIPVGDRADLVIVSCGGHPFDLNFIQAHKSLDFACRALREGGTVIFLAACSAGIGRTGFLDWFKNETMADFCQALMADYRLNGHTALATFIKASRFNILMHTELSRTDLDRMNISKIDNLQETVLRCVSDLPEKGKIIAIPNGHALLPVMKQ